MSVLNKILRVVWLLFVVVILAALVWWFAYPDNYFYYAVGAATLISLVAAFFIFRTPSKKQEKAGRVNEKAEKKDAAGSELEEDSSDQSNQDYSTTDVTDEDTIPVEEDDLDISPLLRKNTGQINTGSGPKLDAIDVAARYRKMAEKVKYGIESEPMRPSIKAASARDAAAKAAAAKEAAASIEQDEKLEEQDYEEDPDLKNGENLEAEVSARTSVAGEAEGEPPLPVIEDESSLTSEEINNLVNAVWYRCENPYCKYTSFLTVHHIVDEKEGGTNKLDNLIVLCPYCHDLAHRNEIPVEEMNAWISNREERFKFKPEWHYF
jgi:predicted HNH restriction endonuclease